MSAQVPPGMTPDDVRSALALARQVSWTWAVIGVAFALPVVILTRSAWGLSAFAPYVLVQAVEVVARRRAKAMLP